MKLLTASASTGSLIPVSVAVTSAAARGLLVVACLGIAIAAVAMIKVHNASFELTAIRASRIAGAGALLCAMALSLALNIGSAN